MQSKFVAPGHVIPFVADADYVAGDVVVVDQLVGCVACNVANGDTGSLIVAGVQDFAKVTGAITAGEAVWWDEDGNPNVGDAGTGGADDTDDTGANKFLGYAIADALSGDQFVRVLRYLPQDVTVNINGSTTSAIADPGNAGAIPVTISGHVAIVTGGAETRTLAAPSFIGQELLIYMKTDGGDCVITCATTINETGNNTITLNDTGDAVRLTAVEEGSNLRWRLAVTDGGTLSTV